MTKYLLSNNPQPDTELGTRICVILFNLYRNPSKEEYDPHLQMRKQAQRAGVTKLHTLISKHLDLQIPIKATDSANMTSND